MGTPPDRVPYREHPYRQLPYLLNSVPGALHHAPLAFAHRGADPRRENTMVAFRRAVELGFRYLEIDVRTSADGQLVIFHDEVLDRLTTGTGKLCDHTWEQLSQLRVTGDPASGTQPRTTPAPDPGEPLVRFEDALRALPETHFNVDLKDAQSVPHFVEVVERLGAHGRVLVASFEDARRRQASRLLSRKVAASGGWVSTALMVFLGPLVGLGRISRLIAGVDCVQVPIRQFKITVVRPTFVRRCHRAGLQVHVWVVNDPAQMHRLLDMGVDGIMTDDAEALADVMRERSVWPQTA
ncbi:glycerophosphodiester phosphodiesterase [Nesterenkonia muleiensis]|uniref:glycerophosphodiester phosphodiesterase n=1 Tax=Nesterenkonia muleiensis TaxID=2282648 RepID=UPI000E75E04C|nr:glycerophosphodiester phosphodiesterase [Nesterenkonia muleiensis]